MHMNYLVEIVYLSLASILLLVLCINLTIQILNIYQVEKSLSIAVPSIDCKVFSESISYIISQLYIRKYQWIEAIQILQLTFKHKQSYDSFNKYSLSSLYHALAYTYRKSSKPMVAAYYTKLALSLNDK
uniref:Ycf37 n=1 Tax=Hildenbrandia rubra TaxID=31481 RepID=A0A1C9CG55_9FLOR|nr:hypothetical protein Hrub_117 [Hildenbrandia rubra]AOM67361.1 hypothetical protein Hrub_117 [Hildenbrandia rubra]